MKGLIYISRATHNIEFEELNLLANDSSAKNSLHGITGYLSYNGTDTFIQYIEGDDNTIKTLFDNIYKDSRHKITHSLSENIKTRRFPNWGMHLLDKHDFKTLHDIMVSHLFYLDSPKVLQYKNRLLWHAVDAISDNIND